MTKSNRVLLWTDTMGFYQGFNDQMSPIFSNHKPSSYYIMTFQNETEVEEHINKEAFEKAYGKMDLISVDIDQIHMKNSKYISAKYLPVYGIKNTIPMFDLLPAEGNA